MGAEEVNVPLHPGVLVGTSHSFLDDEAVSRSLPKELTPASVEAVQATAPLLANDTRAEDIARAFYRRILESHCELFEFFNMTNQRTGRQSKALASALIAFASNVGETGKLKPVLDLIAAKHCSLDVKPHHFLTVHAVLMAAIEEVMGPALTPDVTAAWSEAILYLSGLLVERQKVMTREAKSRNGGWRGFRRFVVTKRTQETLDIVTFTMKPMDAIGVYFDFVPGQFVSVKVDPDGDGATAPRHYTLTSPLGMPYLEIAVKKLPGGKVSTYLHEEMDEGQCLQLSPPFGVFTPVPAALGEKVTAVLISAGIGIAPMLAFLQALGGKVVLAAHVDKSEESHPFRKRFQEAAPVMQVHYTSKEGRPPKDMAAKLTKLVGVDHDWYICAPGGFMCDAMQSLARAGVDATRIHFESFGPQLCPVHVADEVPAGPDPRLAG